VIAQLNKLTPAERRRLLLARVSNQRGRVQFHHGSWSVLYWIRDLSAPSGWRRVRERLNADSENEAVIEAARLLTPINEHNQPGRTSKRPPTVKEFIDREWAAYLTRRERSLSTLSAYKSNLKLHVQPLLGNKRVHHVTPADISKVLAVAGKGKKPKSMVNLYALLRVLFDVAQQHDFTEESPVRPKIHRPVSHKKEKPSLTAEQTWRVLTTVEPEHRLIFIMAALTGYRAGELLALSWSNVDEIKGVVQATHRLWLGKRIPGVKTPKSRKPIQLAGELLLMLREHHELAEFKGPDDFVFCRSDARPYDPQWLLENVWYPALKKIGVEPGKRTHGFHLLRHTAATILAEVTQDRQLVKDFLRHTQMSTTEGYVHEGAAEGSEALAKEIFGRDERVN
jgi:integrase